jgi:ribosomal-protein-alanine N-acetyltransferase
MKSELKIELLSEKDAPCVAKIEQECFSTPFKESDILEYLSNPIWHFFVAKDGENVLGYISFTVIIDECQIVNVATSPAHRKMGIGKLLIEELLSYAKKSEISKVFLEVRESNVAAISLYKKYGFLVVGTSKNHYSQPTEDALLMNLEI